MIFVGFPDTLQSLPQQERQAITRAVERAACITNPAERQAITQAITGIIAARRREQMQAASNRHTERARRRLIGAHVPISLYNRCVRAAAADGNSLYRFTVNALLDACDAADAARRPRH